MNKIGNHFKRQYYQKQNRHQCYILEIPLKINRTKKKVHQKIELTFSFTKEIPLKINRTKIKRFTKKLKLPSMLKEKSLYNIFAFNLK